MVAVFRKSFGLQKIRTVEPPFDDQMEFSFTIEVAFWHLGSDSTLG